MERTSCWVGRLAQWPSWNHGYEETVANFQNSSTFALSVAGGKGVIRSMLCEAEYTAEVIPVDQAISGLIGIAHTVASMKEK
jgi:fatty acyl-CoA reductase